MKSAVSLVLVVLVRLTLSLQNCTPGELTVTGGGIVKENEPVIFKLCLAENVRCSERDR